MAQKETGKRDIVEKKPPILVPKSSSAGQIGHHDNRHGCVEGGVAASAISSQFERLDLNTSTTATKITASSMNVITPRTVASSTLGSVESHCEDVVSVTPTSESTSRPSTSEELSTSDQRTTHINTLTVSATAVSPREQFLVFIKILFKILDQAKELHTRNRAKKLVADCTRKNRQGDPNYTPLMEAVQRRLRLFVGDEHWRKAMLLLRHYYQKRRQRMGQPTIPV